MNVGSSTRYVNGTPSVGSNITVVGSGSCSTSVSASQITVSTGTVSGGSFSVTGKVMDSSTAYAARRTTSVPSGYYLVASTNCGYLHVNVSASTQYPHGVPKAGDNVTATGSGSCSTSVNASIVQDNSGSGGATPSPTSAPTSSPTSAPTSSPTNAPTPLPTAAPTPAGSHTFDHITVIIMENYGYPNILNQSSAPYENALAKRTLLFTNSHGVSHPSEPNYLALFSGSTQGLTSDACPVNYSSSNLATELASAGYSFEGYAEDMPSPVSACEGSSSPYTSGYYYMRKHVPWADFSNVSTSDYHGWSSGESPSGSVNFIVPNMCDDMHDCGVAPGDSWLAENVPAIESWDASHNGLLIVTFDEAEYGSTNQIYTVFDAPSIPAGTSSQYVNHYSVLRYIEDNFGVPRLGSAASASPISVP